MKLPDVPFEVRLAVLLGLLVVVAAVDLALRRREATRWREYLVLLAFALVGCAVGVTTDQVTSRLSPEYFEVGKGIDPGPDFARGVLALSLQAGLSAGFVLGAVLLTANGSRGRPPASLLPLAAWPVVLGLSLAPAGGLLAGALDPGGLERELAGVVEPAGARRRFIAVQGAHAGLYLGALAGTILAMIRVRRERRPAPSPSASDEVASSPS